MGYFAIIIIIIIIVIIIYLIWYKYNNCDKNIYRKINSFTCMNECSTLDTNPTSSCVTGDALGNSVTTTNSKCDAATCKCILNT